MYKEMFSHSLNFREVMCVNSVTTVSKDLCMKDVEKLWLLSPISLICTAIFFNIVFDSKFSKFRMYTVAS